jgi:hypothetical protein
LGCDAFARARGDILPVMRIIIDGLSPGARRASASRAVILTRKRDAIALVHVGLHRGGASPGGGGRRGTLLTLRRAWQAGIVAVEDLSAPRHCPVPRCVKGGPRSGALGQEPAEVAASVAPERDRLAA